MGAAAGAEEHLLRHRGAANYRLARNAGARDRPRAPIAHGELAVGYPTAALAVLTVTASTWRRLGHGTADLVEFVKPRDLE